MERILDADFVSWNPRDAELLGDVAVDSRRWSSQVASREQFEEPTVDPALLALSARQVSPSSLVEHPLGSVENPFEVDQDEEDEDQHERVNLVEEDEGWEDTLEDDAIVQQVFDNMMMEDPESPSPQELDVPYQILSHRLRYGVRLFYQVQAAPGLSTTNLARAKAALLPNWEGSREEILEESTHANGHMGTPTQHGSILSRTADSRLEEAMERLMDADFLSWNPSDVNLLEGLRCVAQEEGRNLFSSS